MKARLKEKTKLESFIIKIICPHDTPIMKYGLNNTLILFESFIFAYKAQITASFVLLSSQTEKRFNG